VANIEETETTNYSTETPVDQTVVAAERPVLSVSGSAVGRRKEAIARVRIVPGSGTITINGRTFEDYFPNKLHQQLVTDPFTVLNLTDAYDVIARISGGGPSVAEPDRRGEQPPDPQEGRLPLARRAHQGAQEGRSQEGPQGASVLEALIGAPSVCRSLARTG
jgi:hypothetical protein